MKFIIYSTLFLISLSLFSCVEKQTSPLDIKIDEVESMEIYHVFRHREDYQNLEKDTTVAIDKKDWNLLINNFNTAKSKGIIKAGITYGITIKLKNKDMITIRRAGDNLFKMEGDEAYTLTKESIEILDRSYKIAPMKEADEEY